MNFEVQQWSTRQLFDSQADVILMNDSQIFVFCTSMPLLSAELLRLVWLQYMVPLFSSAKWCLFCAHQEGQQVFGSVSWTSSLSLHCWRPSWCRTHLRLKVFGPFAHYTTAVWRRLSKLKWTSSHVRRSGLLCTLCLYEILLLSALKCLLLKSVATSVQRLLMPGQDHPGQSNGVTSSLFFSFLTLILLKRLPVTLPGCRSELPSWTSPKLVALSQLPFNPGACKTGITQWSNNSQTSFITSSRPVL